MKANGFLILKSFENSIYAYKIISIIKNILKIKVKHF